jgi:hypothetical protein
MSVVLPKPIVACNVFPEGREERLEEFIIFPTCFFDDDDDDKEDDFNFVFSIEEEGETT